MTTRRRLYAVPDPGKPYKAVAGFLIALVGAFVTAITQHDVDDLGWEGWLAIAATAVLTALGVYEISNPPAEPVAPDEPTAGQLPA